MLVSPADSALTFKDLTGNYPTESNTLHANIKQAGFTSKGYCQKANNGETIPFQLISDVATAVSLRIYEDGTLLATVAGTLINTIVGVVTRTYWNFSVDMTPYNGKVVWMTATQGADVITSEPIKISDLTEDIAKGRIKRVDYNNQDRSNADLSGFFIDWSNIASMFFYIEAQDREIFLTDENEVLRGSQSDTLISATNYTGIILKTGPVPKYMVKRLMTVTSLDTFTVNDIRYIKGDAVDSELFGGSTLFQVTVELTEKNAIGLNVDDLGIETGSSDMDDAIVTVREDAVTGAGVQATRPAEYMLHTVWLQHATTSAAASATVKCGTTVGGDDIFDTTEGTIDKATYVQGGVFLEIPRHKLRNIDNAETLYFTVVGAGAVLRIVINFDRTQV